MKSVSELFTEALNKPFRQAKEIWKPILGYTGLYEISNFGRIKSFKKKTHTTKIIFMKFKIGRGYWRLTLCKNGKERNFTVHRLVAKTFISNFENKPDVIHKNLIKLDNSVENLKWATEKESYIHSKIKGRQKGLSDNEISLIKNIRKKTGMMYKNIGKKFGVKEHVIADIFCKRKRDKKETQ